MPKLSVPLPFPGKTKKRIKVNNMHIVAVIIGIFLGTILASYVFAYNTQSNYVNPPTTTTAGAGYKTASQAATFGHTADELNVKLADGSVMTLQEAILAGKLGGTTTTTTQTPTSSLGDAKCTARGGIATGDFVRDKAHRVEFQPTFPSGVKPIVTITSDMTDKKSTSTTGYALIADVNNLGFSFQSQADLKYLHYAAYDPACFPPITPQSVDSGSCSGVTDGAACSTEWDCCPSVGGAYHCRSGSWVKLTNTQCV